MERSSCGLFKGTEQGRSSVTLRLCCTGRKRPPCPQRSSRFPALRPPQGRVEWPMEKESKGTCLEANAMAMAGLTHRAFPRTRARSPEWQRPKACCRKMTSISPLSVVPLPKPRASHRNLPGTANSPGVAPGAQGQGPRASMAAVPFRRFSGIRGDGGRGLQIQGKE